ncbi:MAG: DUF503 domain-containing protein [Bacillota bacterium]|jgi:uncharacterized protein YlxP (DUF503 family)|nr:DUF503 domain-containing protein [Bacillota bacterium]HOB41754.1 DUF503 domain-containing protein [Bacillota bacterium]HOL51095.1 DUF503 domain-containing protein [Bacillota bacterium]HOO29532.1 DUF503 domain-containing protein [Bacillota bacterium]HPQ01857.1 DUF503 domain-containing protein [Bacillota bacterium]
MRCVLLIEGSRSLKEKKRVIQGMMARIRHRFNVAVAEVDCQDIWNKAQIGIVCVSNDSGHAHSILEAVARMIDLSPDVVLYSYEIEIL